MTRGARRGRGLAGATAVLLSVAALLPAVVSAGADRDGLVPLKRDFTGVVRPLVTRHCGGCHSAGLRQAGVDLLRFANLESVRSETRLWRKVGEQLRRGEMPPRGARPLPAADRQRLVEWVERLTAVEARLSAGDPGPVVLRRLTNAELTYTVQDLTGLNLNPTREFPDDSAAGEGFTNVGNAQAMSPALLSKYLQAGKEIASHAVLLPDGFRFSPSVTRRDWTDELVSEIRALYGRYVDTTDLGVGSEVGNQNVHGDTRLGRAGRLPVERYLAVLLGSRDALRRGSTTPLRLAAKHGLSSRYLMALNRALSATDGSGSLLISRLRRSYRDAGPGGAHALAEEIGRWQRGLWAFGPVGLIGRQGGPPRWMEPMTPLLPRHEIRVPLPALKGAARAGGVTVTLQVTSAGDGADGDVVVFRTPRLAGGGKPELPLKAIRGLVAGQAPGGGEPAWGLDSALFGKRPDGSEIDSGSICVQAPVRLTVRIPAELADGRELVTTAELDSKLGAGGSVQPEAIVGEPPAGPLDSTVLLPSEINVNYSQVTSVFSDRRDVAYRFPVVATEGGAAWRRFETAFHEHRVLFPPALCYPQIVPVDEVLTLTLFYREDDHLARLMLDAPEQARLNRLWRELEFVAQAPLQRVQALEIMLEVLVGSSQYRAVEALRKPFAERAAEFRREAAAAEARQFDALLRFAPRVYRRPLTGEEQADLRGLFRRLKSDGIPHEEAFSLALSRLFVASPFLYRLENAPRGRGAAPISDWELASRLSYFLWSSAPDAELSAAAATGRLHEPDVLVRQVRRMQRDPRVRRLATEFACQWLHLYQFDTVGEKSEKHFPEFAELRRDMHEEVIRFFTEMTRSDGSALELLDADHTFVNGRLAKFYGLSGVLGETWRRVSGMRTRGRGGVLGFAATLAKQSGASRSSPILRGNWISEVLLGERLPRPPANVPQLPADESSLKGLSLRQVVARHTSDPACSGCHRRIDPFGFALEGFDGIGRARARDLSAPAIDTTAVLPDGARVTGLPGLRDYLRTRRRDEVLRQFTRKLLGYALGRELQLSDEPLLAEIRRRMANENYRVGAALESIALSRPFLEIRGDAGVRVADRGVPARADAVRKGASR